MCVCDIDISTHLDYMLYYTPCIANGYAWEDFNDRADEHDHERDYAKLITTM